MGFQERRSQGKKQEISLLRELNGNHIHHEGSKTIWRRLWLQPVLMKPVTDEGR